jgi:MFS family permease
VATSEGIQATPAVSERDVRKVAAVSLVGASVEWFDFFLFGTAAALVFPVLFYGDDAGTSNLMKSFATFGIGFLARPIGGVVWGHFGDKVGRKKAFMAALGLMAVASFLIGCLPTYASIGVTAPILLAVLRFCQGLAVGGQWGGAALMATESAPAHKRGYYGAFAQVGVPVGVLLGLGGYFFLFLQLGPEAFLDYGWRLPFLASVLFVGVVVYTKSRLEDSPAFKNLQAAATAKATTAPAVTKSPITEVLVHHWSSVLLAGGAFIVVNASFYLYLVFLPAYGTATLGMTMGQVLGAISIATIVVIPALLGFGAISDRVGRRPLYLAGAVLTAVWAIPAFKLIDQGTLGSVTVAVTVGMLTLAMMYGPLAAFFGELFPPEIRYSGASLGYQLGAVIGGAATPLLATELIESTGTSNSLALLLIGLSVLAVVCILALSSRHTQDSQAS